MVEDLDEGAREDCMEAVALLTFASLAAREFGQAWAPYANSTHFRWYAQPATGGVRDFALVTRSAAGRVLHGGYRFDETFFTRPEHASGPGSAPVDGTLLDGLVAMRTKLDPQRWVRWMDALRCFNQANTDDHVVPHQVEWILMVGAFQRLLAVTSSKGRDVAAAFRQALRPTEDRYSAAFSHITPHANGSEVVRETWMREFYEVRGGFAHGHQNTHKPTPWNTAEHLMLARHTLPILARSVLATDGGLALAARDRDRVDALEEVMSLVDLAKSWRPAELGSSPFLAAEERARDARRLRDVVNRLERLRADGGADPSGREDPQSRSDPTT